MADNKNYSLNGIVENTEENVFFWRFRIGNFYNGGKNIQLFYNQVWKHLIANF